ncbi:hypothetical protein QCA50_018152 [Cerrena zonata]|uniref:PPM-type phosphatase domain-containing protein n=1 Tax=Cerrena zonata TaxID=2478898 RepID=A0AAW0FQ54_9APHY
MEDVHTYVANFAERLDWGYFAIFDGHAGKQSARWCAKPDPTNNAVGAAKPNPHGQAITKTAIANSSDQTVQPPISTSR